MNLTINLLPMNRQTPSFNGRFCEMAAVTPQTILCEIARLSPAGSSVKPPPRKAAGTLGASRRVRGGQRRENLKIS